MTSILIFFLLSLIFQLFSSGVNLFRQFQNFQSRAFQGNAKHQLWMCKNSFFPQNNHRSIIGISYYNSDFIQNFIQPYRNNSKENIFSGIKISETRYCPLHSHPEGSVFAPQYSMAISNDK